MIWVTADTHFGHENIINFCGRPFFDAEEMNDRLVGRWNQVVMPGDVVYHLGDFAYRCPRGDVSRIIDRLNGKLIIVPGSHDETKTMRPFSHLFESRLIEIEEGGRLVVLCHYPLDCWHHSYRGAVHLHGHSHGKAKVRGGRLDVGVDVHEYRPLSLARAIELAQEPR